MTSTSRWSKWSTNSLRVAIVIGLSVSIPMLAALVVLVGGARWFPCGDMAQAELHMRGFLSHPPLVGAAGRIVDDAGFQGSHPGRVCGWRCTPSTPSVVVAVRP